MGPMIVIILVVSAALHLVLLVFAAFCLTPWLLSLLQGAPIRFRDVVGMWFRRSGANAIVLAYTKAWRGDLPLSVHQIETHALSGGSAATAVDALRIAHDSGAPTSWDLVCPLDLAGKPIIEVVSAVANAHACGVNVGVKAAVRLAESGREIVDTGPRAAALGRWTVDASTEPAILDKVAPPLRP